MFVNFQIILLTIFVASVVTVERKLDKSDHQLWVGISERFNPLVKRSIDGLLDEKLEITSENPEIKDDSKGTDAPIDSTKATLNDVTKEEEVKEETNKDLEVKKVGERIEREDESGERPVVTPETPKEVEEMTPQSQTPLPPITLPTVPSVPTATKPTVPPTRPLYPILPTFPTNNIPNYWETPNWGNWGRFVPQTLNWPQRPQWPSVGWPSNPSTPQIPTYNPSTLYPARYTPGYFGIPGSGITTFSFLVPQNPYPSGRGFQFPGARPSIPQFPGYQPQPQPGYQPQPQPGYQPQPQPGYQPQPQPGYQPRFVPNNGQQPGYYPGIGGQTPSFNPGFGGQPPNAYPGFGGQPPNQYPGMGGQNPSHYPGFGGQEPRHYPGGNGGQAPQQPPPAQPGADPNRPLGPMGPEFNDPDVTMLDGSPTNSIARRFPSKVRRLFIRS